MHRFIHTTEATFSARPTNLPAGAKVVEAERKGVKVFLVHLTEELTVPTTTDDLIAIARQEEAETTVDCGGVKVKCSTACKRYIVGRKLESNQARQSDLRSGVSAERRGDALAYWSEVDIKSATASMIKAVRDKAYAKEHNAKLDTLAELMESGDEKQAGAFLLKLNQPE